MSLPCVEVQTQQVQQACWSYAWDHQEACLRIMGIRQANTELPADLATLRLEGQRDVPVALLTNMSIAPETRVLVRLLGALQSSPEQQDDANRFPLDGWLLLAIPDLQDAPLSITSITQIPQEQLAALHTYMRSQAFPGTEIVQHSAATVEQRLREARLWLKQEQRRTAQRQRVSSLEEEKAVSWRAVEGLTTEQRQRIAQVRTLEELAPYLQAEQLIRAVPARFQRALVQLLLDEERLLAFFQRPLLHHRTGLFGMHQWRSNEGLLLVTDSHLFWLRDFLSPGSSVLPEGYIAHAVPLERLKGVHLLATGAAPVQRWVHDLASNISPYQRLILEIACAAGSETMGIEFPSSTITEQALARLVPLLQAFLPRSEGSVERRVRRLPVVEAWNPSRSEEERLTRLGGTVSVESAQRLERQLAEYCHATGEEVLVSGLIPALEAHRSPTRLLVLTRQAVLTLDEVEEKAYHWSNNRCKKRVVERRYALARISSVQISYSLLGATLRLFVPQQGRETQQHVIPFQSPAIAWLLPLFTRLRMLLCAPIF